MFDRRDVPLARQVLALQLAITLVIVSAFAGWAWYSADRKATGLAAQRARDVATSVADSPAVISATRRPDPTRVLQPYAERVRRDTGVDFVVVMDLSRRRWTHPTPERIGEVFLGDVGRAREGEVFTQTYTGTLGPSVRAVVPVKDRGRTIALVSVGITVTRIDQGLRRDLIGVAATGLALLLAGTVGAGYVHRRLRRQTHGLGEREITRMYEYYAAVLSAVREGLLLLDGSGRIQLANDEARRLLDLPEDPIGRRMADLGLPPGLVTAATGQVPGEDDIYVQGNRVLVVNHAPARWRGREVGAVVTLRDHTELQAVSGELDLVRGLTDALRAQNHESANRLHTVVSLIERGESQRAVEFATSELAIAQMLTDTMVAEVADPALAALLVAKAAQAAERGVELDLAHAVYDGSESAGISSRDLITVVGNLVDNALDAVARTPHPRVRVELGPDEEGLVVVVGDSGPGIPVTQRDAVSERGWTTKASDGTGRGVGLALVLQVVRRYGGDLEIGTSPLGGAELTATLPVAEDRR